MIFFDTEGVGGTGPLVTFQYATLQQLEENPKSCIFHKIWERPLKDTVRLIEQFCTFDAGVCGFNLVHDWFQINKWYNVFRQLTPEELNDVNPRGNLVLRVKDIEARGPQPTDVCLKPRKALDLMLIARAGKYQYLAKHKSIILRKVPSVLLEGEERESAFYSLLNSRASLPSGIRIRWRKSQKKSGRRDVVDVLGDLFPSSSFESCECKFCIKYIKENGPGSSILCSVCRGKCEENLQLKSGAATKKQTFASLKQLAALVLGDEKIAEGTFEQEVLGGNKLPYREEPDFKPWGGEWRQGLRVLCDTFNGSLPGSDRAITYACRDVYYTYEVWRSLQSDQSTELLGGDDDSELACLVGASYWKGFAIDSREDFKKIREQISHYDEVIQRMQEIGVNCNAPASVLSYLHSMCSNDLDRLSIPDTKKITLEAIERGEEWEGHPAKNAVKKIQIARKALKRRHMLEGLLNAQRFCFAMKIQGTLSSRMAGGTDRELTTTGKTERLNPQGIPREKEFRSLFTLAFDDETLEGGDFEAFEVSIADVIYQDPQLREDVLSKVKIHATIGSLFYNVSVADVLATKGTTKQDKYDNAKRAFFAYLYGGTAFSLKKHLGLEESEIEPGLKRLLARYKEIKKHRDTLRRRFIPLTQERGAGTEIEWQEPDDYIEAIKLPWQESGYRRTFQIEWAVIRALYSLAIEPPKEWTSIPGSCRRTNRVQSIVGATQSALYASIFALQEHVFRAAANHEIQSPGAQITKHLQRKIWDLQPSGIEAWKVRPFNSHDEVQVPCRIVGIVQNVGMSSTHYSNQVSQPGVISVKAVVTQFLLELQQVIPLLQITWQTNLNNWGEKI